MAESDALHHNDMNLQSWNLVLVVSIVYRKVAPQYRLQQAVLDVRVNWRVMFYRASALNALLEVALRGAPRTHQVAGESSAGTAYCVSAPHP